MILVDTSVWTDHLRRSEPALRTLLLDDRAAMHDGVIQELALGSLAARDEVLAALGRLTRLPALWTRDRRLRAAASDLSVPLYEE